MSLEKKKKMIKMVDIVSSKKKHTSKTDKNEDKNDVNYFEPKKKKYNLKANSILNDSAEKQGKFLKELGELKEENEDEPRRKPRKKIFKKKRSKRIAVIIVSLIVLLAIYIIVAVLPRATVKIVTHKLPWEFKKSVVVDTGINDIDTSLARIPGELFSQNKNITLSFDASSKKYVERKAVGKISVINAYSSSPQVLIKNTRFEDLDGHIFRLTEKIKVPGATVVDGKITPSSIEADVIADKAGDQYNIGPVKKFTIPGFLGSPRFNGFYGRSESPMIGGIIGDVKYPTDEDISNAKKEVEKVLTKQIVVDLKSQVPDGFVLLDDAISYDITKLETNKIVDSDGKFNFFGEGEAKGMIFKKDDMFNMLHKKGLNDVGADDNFVVKEEENNYGKPTINFDNGEMTVPLNYNVVFWPDLNINEISNKIIGNDAIKLKTYILAISNIDKLTVSFWPFWVKKVPNKESRLKLYIE